MYKNVLIGVGLYLIAHIGTWFQLNSQFFSKWAKDHWVLITCTFSIPIGLLFVYGTKYMAEGFDGMLWPGRIIGFSIGTFVFGIFTYLIMNEPINLKTSVLLGLSVLIILIQILWK